MDDRPYMPNHELLISHLDDFKHWLTVNGWRLETPRNKCVLMRATKHRKRPLAVYKTTQKLGGRAITHYSFTAGYEGILWEFVNEIEEGE